METSSDALRKVQLQERHQPQLCVLDDGFYDEYLRFLSDSESRLKDDFSLEATKTLESGRKILNDIFALRKQKIFFKALKEFQSGTVSSQGLSGPEKDLYTGLIKLLSTTSGLEALPKTAAMVDVEVLADIPAFVGLDSKPYGPFKTGQMICLPLGQAAFLSKKNVVKVLKG